MNKEIIRDLSYGVYVVGWRDNGYNGGCIVNSAMQITSNPMTIAISVNTENYTHDCIKRSSKFSLSILNEESDEKLIGTFGYQSSKDVDKYANFEYELVEDVPVILDSNGYLICEVIATLEAGSHTIFVGKVVQAKRLAEKAVMTYRYYQEVLKGKSPKNAPTYIDIEGEIKTNQWVCSICGYVYEGEELPDDFICPLCMATKEAFIKVEK